MFLDAVALGSAVNMAVVFGNVGEMSRVKCLC